MRRSLLRTLPLLLVAFMLTSTVNATTEPESGSSKIHGLWLESKKQKVAVWIENCDQHLCGYIYWLKKPLSADGLPKRDKHNPDVTLSDRPLCGLKILKGFTFTRRNSWSGGEIYNPKDGRTFNSTIKRVDDGSLKIRGYFGIPLFGKTLKWLRPEKNLQQCSQSLTHSDTKWITPLPAILQMPHR